MQERLKGSDHEYIRPFEPGVLKVEKLGILKVPLPRREVPHDPRICTGQYQDQNSQLQRDAPGTDELRLGFREAD